VSGITPRAAQLRQQSTEYLTEARSIVGASLTAAETSTGFGDVYHASLSTETVLAAFRNAHLRPRLAGARLVALRIPLLVGIGQGSVAIVELRRFVELICWSVYFTDHPVEWRSFETDLGAGFSQDMRKPISYAAHRELNYYVEYSRELMGRDASGLGIRAVEGIKQASHELNASVHAGHAAHTTAGTPPYEDVSDATLRKFSRIQRQVFSNCCLLLAAYRRPQFERLNAAARAHFDWLVGSKLRKEVRQGGFGLPPI
jgi:hypothetical protein